MWPVKELTVNGLYNICVEISVSVIQRLVIVEVIPSLTKTPGIIIVAINQKLVVKPTGDTFNVKARKSGQVNHVMGLVDKRPKGATPCYPAKTKVNVTQEFMHAEENLNARSELHFPKHFLKFDVERKTKYFRWGKGKSLT